MHTGLGYYTSMVNMRATEGDVKVMSLDDIRAVAKKIFEVEIDKHSVDGLGRVDYALGTGGGRVVGHSEGYFVGSGWSWGRGALDMLTLNFEGLHRDANKMLKPSFGEPGQCLPLPQNPPVMNCMFVYIYIYIYILGTLHIATHCNSFAYFLRFQLS